MATFSIPVLGKSFLLPLHMIGLLAIRGFSRRTFDMKVIEWGFLIFYKY
jgi:hypothetical protein